MNQVSLTDAHGVDFNFLDIRRSLIRIQKDVGSLSEVNTATEEFNKLLDSIHEVNRVEPIKKMEISSLEVLMEQFGSVSPPPFQDWKDIIAHTTQEFMKLPHDAGRDDIASAAARISMISSEAEDMIYSTQNDGRFSYLNPRANNRSYRGMISSMFFRIISLLLSSDSWPSLIQRDLPYPSK